MRTPRLHCLLALAASFSFCALAHAQNFLLTDKKPLEIPASVAEAPPDFAKWEKEIAAFETSDKVRPPKKGGILFVGSSSIRLWKTLSEDFPGLNVINRGFGGSQIEDSTQFAERIIFPHAPSTVILYAGGNDLHFGKTSQQVFENFKAFAQKVRAQLPSVKLAYISIAGNPSRWSEVEKIKEANSLISNYLNTQPGMSFINVFPEMLGPDGMPIPEIFVADKLHMNAQGYQIWTRVISRYLQQAE